MSSVKEYWKRARTAAQSDFETSSDYSFEDSSSSISKEYRDASCNVDSDDSTHELIDKNVPSLLDNKLTADIEDSTIVREDRVKSSTYVRWDVLMSLGIGLWAVLCIVDLLHSEKSVTKDWVFAFWERKIPAKIELPKKLEDQPVIWYSKMARHAWRFTTTMTSGGAYVLLFLLMIVFCADPRIRSHRSSVKDNSPEAIEATDTEKKSSIVKKPVSRLERPRIPKIVSVRLELPPLMELQKKVFPIGECVQVDSRKIGNSPMSGESATCFSVDRLVELLEANNRSTLTLTSVERRTGWSSYGKVEAVHKDTVSLSLDTRRSDLNFNENTFDLEIEEYLGRTRQSTSNVLVESSRDRNHEKPRELLPLQSETSIRGESAKSRIITSSPAFKKFFSSFQHNSAVS